MIQTWEGAAVVRSWGCRGSATSQRESWVCLRVLHRTWHLTWELGKISMNTELYLAQGEKKMKETSSIFPGSCLLSIYREWLWRVGSSNTWEGTKLWGVDLNVWFLRTAGELQICIWLFSAVNRLYMEYKEKLGLLTNSMNGILWTEGTLSIFLPKKVRDSECSHSLVKLTENNGIRCNHWNVILHVKRDCIF